MRRLLISLAALGLTVGLMGCGKIKVTPTVGAEPGTDPLYWSAPVTTEVMQAGPRIVLVGKARPGATIRLATPHGRAAEGVVASDGSWRLSIPAAGQDGLFALSAKVAERTVQSEGYLFISANGLAAQLRAGGGALRLGPSGPASGVTAFDFDRAGGAVVSGRGPAGGAISARLDGRKVGEGRIDKHGRFALPFPEPLTPGSHSLKVFGEAVEAVLTIDASRAETMTGGPIRVRPVSAGVRIDWITPGGGVQTTILVS